MVLLLIKLNLYFTDVPRIQRGSIIFQGGGVVQLYLGGGGPNANFYRNPYMYLVFSRGVSGPPIPLWIRTWTMPS